MIVVLLFCTHIQRTIEKGQNKQNATTMEEFPHTSQNIYPTNAYWSTSYKNYLVDFAAENANGFLLDSKDAERIVCGDMAPILKSGRS